MAISRRFDSSAGCEAAGRRVVLIVGDDSTGLNDDIFLDEAVLYLVGFPPPAQESF